MHAAFGRTTFLLDGTVDHEEHHTNDLTPRYTGDSRTPCSTELSGGPLGVGGELMYAQRGIVGGSGNSRELDYIDVPVYVRVGMTVPEVQPFAYLGPQISYELKCGSDGGSCPSGRDRWSYAGVIGAGLRFQQAMGLSVEARYIYGLTDLKLGTVTDSENYQTRSFMLLMGIGF